MSWKKASVILSVLIAVIVINLLLNYASLALPVKIISIAAVVVLAATLLDVRHKAQEQQ